MAVSITAPLNLIFKSDIHNSVFLMIWNALVCLHHRRCYSIGMFSWRELATDSFKAVVLMQFILHVLEWIFDVVFCIDHV